MTAPGQTAAVSVFIDPLIASLDVSRTELSTSYLIGTLLGAAAMPWVGRGLDRYGVRPMMVGVGVLFGAVLVGIGCATSLTGLTVGFIGIRMCGQGALSLVATTLVAVHATRRRGLMLGVTAGAGSAGVSMAPLLLEALVAGRGTHDIWIAEGFAVWLVVVPIGVIALRRLPSPRPTSAAAVSSDEAVPDFGVQWTTRAASRTAMFWAIIGGLSISGMLSTGLNFHQIAILGERGLSPAAAAANFIPQTVAAIVGTLIVGAFVDVIAPKYGVALSMATLSVSLALTPLVTPGVAALGYGLALGFSGGSIRAVEAAAFAHYFGTRHIGSIRGIAMTASVASTAFGPLAVSLGHDLTGHYTTTLLVLAPIPLLAMVFAILAPTPHPPGTGVFIESK